MNPQVFREYDIRGIVQDDFDDEFVVNLGRSYATILIEAGKQNITLGRDCRLSSDMLRERLLDRDPQQVAEPLNYVLSLAEAALVEMRALIFELRPESLEQDGLVRALAHQAAAVQARHRLIVSTSFCEEPAQPLKIKQELYRVAQEALQNTVKHARWRWNCSNSRPPSIAVWSSLKT